MNKLRSLVFTALFLLAASNLAARAAAGPVVFWASDPVRPDETVLIEGADLGPTPLVEMARVEDGDPLAVTPDSKTPIAGSAMAAAEPKLGPWTATPVLQADEASLKFVVPAGWKPGVFAYRITVGGTTSAPRLLNAPDPWWMQGDEGEAATAGGWLRVLGKSLSSAVGKVALRLEPAEGMPIVLKPSERAGAADDYSAQFDLPRDLPIGVYTVRIHNGAGGLTAWRLAGNMKIIAPPPQPSTVFSVLEMYGTAAVKEMRDTLGKYRQPIDRTEGIQAALKKAKENGGGVVYFPGGRYAIKGHIEVPEHTILKGEGMGTVTIWWGAGHFNLDGGGPQGRARSKDEPKPPDVLISGPDYGLEDMSLYLPLDYQQGIVADHRLRMHRVRVRIDHSWLLEGRGDGTVVRMGKNFQLTDCDILAKGSAMRLGQYGVVERNRILAMKVNTELGGAREVIVENNQFVSMDPTTYQNIAGRGRNIFYGHNQHESLFVHQADYSFTFDASAGAYFGAIAETKGTHVTLAADPTYPKWAPENSDWWRWAVMCIMDGRGAGQWRDVTANHGRDWQIDRPFDVPPDAASIVTIVPFSGRTLMIGNRFEDPAWVNAGYGTSIDVVCAQNTLVRAGLLVNYGVHSEDWYEPSWHVQFFDNRITEGQTDVELNGGGHKSPTYSGPLTRCVVHRRDTLTADNSGSLRVNGNPRYGIIEGCTLEHPLSQIRIGDEGRGVLVRKNVFGGPGGPRYDGPGVKKALVEAEPAGAAAPGAATP